MMDDAQRIAVLDRMLGDLLAIAQQKKVDGAASLAAQVSNELSGLKRELSEAYRMIGDLRQLVDSHQSLLDALAAEFMEHRGRPDHHTPARFAGQPPVVGPGRMNDLKVIHITSRPVTSDPVIPEVEVKLPSYGRTRSKK